LCLENEGPCKLYLFREIIVCTSSIGHVYTTNPSQYRKCDYILTSATVKTPPTEVTSVKYRNDSHVLISIGTKFQSIIKYSILYDISTGSFELNLVYIKQALTEPTPRIGQYDVV
jgi:hypothetical protein